VASWHKVDKSRPKTCDTQHLVLPAKAGIHDLASGIEEAVDSRLRGSDKQSGVIRPER